MGQELFGEDSRMGVQKAHGGQSSKHSSSAGRPGMCVNPAYAAARYSPVALAPSDQPASVAMFTRLSPLTLSRLRSSTPSAAA